MHAAVAKLCSIVPVLSWVWYIYQKRVLRFKGTWQKFPGFSVGNKTKFLPQMTKQLLENQFLTLHSI